MMRPIRSSNLSADINAFLAGEEAALRGLPRCSICGGPIQQEMAVKLDENFICDDCLDNLRVSVERD